MAETTYGTSGERYIAPMAHIPELSPKTAVLLRPSDGPESIKGQNKVRGQQRAVATARLRELFDKNVQRVDAEYVFDYDRNGTPLPNEDDRGRRIRVTYEVPEGDAPVAQYETTLGDPEVPQLVSDSAVRESLEDVAMVNLVQNRYVHRAVIGEPAPTAARPNLVEFSERELAAYFSGLLFPQTVTAAGQEMLG